MKIYALNGSPRKNQNTAQMLDSFLKGVADAADDAEITKVDVYDLKASGCRSCYGCRIKTLEPGQCIVKDGAYEVLRGIRESDGFVLASPIYWWDVTAELRGILERLFYSMLTLPEGAKKKIQTATIYTMNQPKEVMEKRFTPLLDPIARFLEDFFLTEPERICSFETLHFNDPKKYVGFTEELFKERMEIHETRFPQDLQNAYDAGVRMAERVRAS